MILKVCLFIVLGITIFSYLWAFYLKKVKQEVDGHNEVVIPVINLYSFLAYVRAFALAIEFITLFLIDPNEIQNDSQRYLIAIQIILSNFSWICYCLSIISIFEIIIRKLSGSLEDNNEEQLSYRIFDKMIRIAGLSIFIVFLLIIYPFIINDIEGINHISFNFGNDVLYYTYILPDIPNWVMIGLFTLLLGYNIYQMIRALQLRDKHYLIKRAITHKQGRFYPAGVIGEMIIYLDLTIRILAQQDIRSDSESYMITLYCIVIVKLLLESVSTPFIVCLYWDILQNTTHSIQQTLDFAESSESKTFSSSKPSNILVKSQDIPTQQLLEEEERKSLE